jgi:glucuronate isomerase
MISKRRWRELRQPGPSVKRAGKRHRMALHPDRLFPVAPDARAIARRLYQAVAGLPLLSPHGHTDPRWYAENKPFSDPATLFVQPDHYIFRMLYSQGVPL